MLRGRKACDRPIATVMVGNNQPIGGDNTGRTVTTSCSGSITPSAKLHYGILKAVIVDTIDLFSGKLQALFLHIALVQALEEHQEPHPLIGSDHRGQK